MNRIKLGFKMLLLLLAFFIILIFSVCSLYSQKEAVAGEKKDAEAEETGDKLTEAKKEGTSEKTQSRNTAYTAFAKTFHYNDNFSFDYIQIKGLSDKALENKINKTLEDASTLWVNEHVLWWEPLNPHVLYQSDELLSVCTAFERFDRRYEHTSICITMNLQTGERIFLDDIVEVNEAFAELIRDGNIAYSEYDNEDYETEGMREFIKMMSVEELLSEIENCSYARNPSDEYPSKIYANSFYLKEGQLHLVLDLLENYYYYTSIVIGTDDISEFLKVEPW